MNHYSDESHVNVGTGEDISIAQLAEIIKRIVGYEGNIVYDTSKPDGTPRKLLDVSLLHKIGYKYQTNLEDGIRNVYHWYVNNNPQKDK